MIVVQDDFLPVDKFLSLQDYCNKVKFVEHEVGEKSFLIANTPENALSELRVEGYKIILSFIRKAHKNFDTDLRIHADGIIDGQKTDLASVLYINSSEGVTTNGTAFWEHFKHGHKLPDDFTNEEFDRLLTEDANQKENFTMTDKIMARPNRLLLYDASYFHSKFPRKISKGERIVLVTFYSKID